jgi:maleate isomerase
MYGHRARIGYTSPLFVTEVFAYEFYAIVPKGVTLMVTTLDIITRSKDEVENSFDKSLRAAQEMAKGGADVVVLGGNPINLTLGVENLADLIAGLERKIGTRVATSTTSQIKALGTLGASKIATVHPFTEAHAPRHEDSIRKFGFEPTGTIGAGSELRDVGRIAKATALDLARRVKDANPDADTIHFACAHWAVAEIIDTVEDELGVDVMTSHQAILWQALRAAGIDDAITGFGRLFREF